MIVIPSDVLTDMLDQARQDAPIEACGLLAGTDATVRQSYRLTNVDRSPEHFSLDPREQFAAIKDARGRGLEILALYHSHPATPARMSAEDLRLAFTPGIQYVIVSLAGPTRPAIKSFSVSNGQPVEEPVLIT